jgi:hypothetical protein
MAVSQPSIRSEGWRVPPATQPSPPNSVGLRWSTWRRFDPSSSPSGDCLPEVYIREARKRVMVDNAFTRLDEHRKKSVSLTGQKRAGETNRGIKYGKSKQK